MGIQGLLQALKPVTEVCNIREYSGKVVGVDAYVWLHRGAYGCAYELCTGGPAATSAYIRYFIGMVDMLLENGVTPFLVFDGGPLPAKAEQETARNRKREEAMQLALQLRQQGDHAAARNQYVRAVDINPEMAARVINTLKQCRQSVKYVVAPYEADAQLAYLCKERIVSAVISEDSDTLPYGCNDVIFKLERNGMGQRIQLESMFSKKIAGFDLRGFDHDMFVMMCILSGCDYLASIPGMGLKKARNYVAKHKTHARLFRMLKLDGTISALKTEQYEQEFEKAWLTMTHQIVFDLESNATRYLAPVPQATLDKYPDLSFLGTILSDNAAQAIATAMMDPIMNRLFKLDGKDVQCLPSPSPVADIAVTLPRIESFFKPQPVKSPASSSLKGSAPTSGPQAQPQRVSAPRQCSPVPSDREAGSDGITNSQLSDGTSVESVSTNGSQSSSSCTPTTAEVISGGRKSAFFSSTPSSASSSTELSYDIQKQNNRVPIQQTSAPPLLLKSKGFISRRNARVAGIQRRRSVSHNHQLQTGALYGGERSNKENVSSTVRAGQKRRRHTAPATPATTLGAEEASGPATPDKIDKGYRDSVSPPKNIFSLYTCDVTQKSRSIGSGNTTTNSSSLSVSTTSVLNLQQRQQRQQQQQQQQQLARDDNIWLTCARETVTDSDCDDDPDGWSTVNSPAKKTKSTKTTPLNISALEEFRFVANTI